MLQVRSVTLRFGARVVLDRVSLQVQAGEIVAVLGASGSGKTTLLRVIAGLETPDAGTVWLAGANISATPVHQRGIGMVFQDNQLFPHLGVADNIAYALRVQGIAAPQRHQRVRAALELVGLADFEARAAVAAAAFAFAVSLGEFGASSFLTRRTTATLPVEISRLLARPGDLVQAQGYVLTTLLVLLTVSAIAAVDGLRPERLTI